MIFSVFFHLSLYHIMQIFARNTAGSIIILDVELNDTMADVKSKIYNQTGIPASRLILRFEGYVLNDGEQLASYTIGENCIVNYQITDILETERSIRVKNQNNDLIYYGLPGVIGSMAAATDVKIYDGITKIPGGMFGGCSLLDTISFPTTLTTFGNGYIDTKLDEVCAYVKKMDAGEWLLLADDIKPGLLNSMDSNMELSENDIDIFKGCSSLTSVDLSGTHLVSISSFAFMDCSKLTSVHLPNTVVAIGCKSFWNCSELININLEHVRYFFEDTFTGCTKLKEITLSSDIVFIHRGIFSGITIDTIYTDNKVKLKAILDKFQVTNYTTIVEAPIMVSNTCFPANTLIMTDDGEIEIQNIKPGKHTIRKREIVAITQTRLRDNYIVRFERDAIATNIPIRITDISPNHTVFYRGQMVAAKQFLHPHFEDKIHKIPYNGEILYNVLLKEHDKMIVSNLIVETLDPNNLVSGVHRLTGVEQSKYIISRGLEQG